MRNLIIGISLSIAFFLTTSCKKNIVSGDLIITDVNVIDVVNGTTNSNQTIAIKNDKIYSVTPFSESDEIISETVIDGKGKYMIPALWDMHTHYTTSSEHKGFLKLFIANGVLGVRDLWGDLESRDSLAASNAIAPTIFLSGAIIDGPFTLLQGSLQPKTSEEAIRMVDSLHQKGSDFIKVYDDLSVEIYNTIANRCKELQIPFAGHVPMSIKAAVASKKGQKSMEHLNGIWKSSTSMEKEIDSLEKVFKYNFMSGNMPGAINTFTEVNT
ncbi:MAG: amidohydrolase family protein, partial [Flavobacteriaceae bacterium]